MVEVALSGNLDFVPLDEVLRLLTRSEQQGAVNVQGDQVRGRIFISKRGVGLATTSDDETLRRHLINSGYVDDDYLDGVEAGEASLAPLSEEADGGITGLLREMTIESLYQLSHNGVSFEVTEGTTSPYVSPSPFDLEAALEDSRHRSEEWSEVSRVVADLNALIKMNREIGDRDSVQISRSAWKLLCEMGSGASVSTLAGRLGTTEFWTAQVAADMTDRGLLVVGVEADAEVEEADEPEWAKVTEVTGADESWWQEPEDETPVSETQDEDEPEAVEHVEVETGEAELEEVEEKAGPDKGRFFGQFAPKRDETLDYQPVADGAEEPADLEPVEDEPADEIAEEPVTAEAEIHEDALPPLESEETAEVEEDTEAFLEKVFSELESNGQPEDESHGLLRRRRLGSVLKELDED
jgi:hypothetical protein